MHAGSGAWDWCEEELILIDRDNGRLIAGHDTEWGLESHHLFQALLLAAKAHTKIASIDN